ITAAAIGAIGGAVVARLLPARSQPVEAAASAPASGDDPAAEGAFMRLVRALPIGVVLVDQHHRVEFANPAAAAIFGFDADKAVYGHVIEAIPNVDLERRIA